MTHSPLHIDFNPNRFYAKTICQLSASEMGVYWLICCIVYSNQNSIDYDETRLASILCKTHRKVIKAALERLQELGKIFVIDGKITINSDDIDGSGVILSIGDGAFLRQSISKSLRSEIIQRDGERCVYCGCTEGPWQIDHVIPVSRGGLTVLENLALSCAPCNRSKGDKTLEECIK